MNKTKQKKDSFETLPDCIGGYKKRIMMLDDFVVVEYSKRQLFIRHIHPDSIPTDEVDKYLLFDVVASSVDEAIRKMREKIELYKNKSAK